MLRYLALPQTASANWRAGRSCSHRALPAAAPQLRLRTAGYCMIALMRGGACTGRACICLRLREYAARAGNSGSRRDFFRGGQNFQPVAQSVNGTELVNLPRAMKLPQLQLGTQARGVRIQRA